MGRALRFAGIGACTLAGVLGLWWLYTTQNDFPINFHTDETKKIRFALTQEQDFHHPILMIQGMRVARELFGITSQQGMLEAGRTLSAGYVLLGVLLAWIVYRRFLPGPWAVGAAAALAVTPLLAVHAHYVKEDAIFLPAVLLALWSLLRFVERPDRGARALVLGLGLGVALAAQYKAVMLVALAWGLPWLGAAPRTDEYFAGLRRACGLATAVFLVVCYPLFVHFGTFGGGFSGQVTHALSGHYVKIYALPEMFSYHLRESLLPGLSPPLLALGIAGTAWAIASWRSLDRPWRIALLYLGVFYLSAELSPSKPPPDFMRYMMPAAPVVVLLAFGLLRKVGSLAPAIAGGLAALSLGIAGWDSVQLVTRLERDTRHEAAAAVQALESGGARVLVESHASVGGTPLDHSELQDPDVLRAEGWTHIALSSFAVDRYLDGDQRSYQRAEIYQAGAVVRRLLALPHREIRPEVRTFAFSNPTIWIVDLGAER